MSCMFPGSMQIDHSEKFDQGRLRKETPPCMSHLVATQGCTNMSRIDRVYGIPSGDFSTKLEVSGKKSNCES